MEPLFISLGLLPEERGCGFMRPGGLSQILTDSSSYGTLCVSISPPWLLSPIKSTSAEGIIKTARVDLS